MFLSDGENYSHTFQEFQISQVQPQSLTKGRTSQKCSNWFSIEFVNTSVAFVLGLKSISIYALLWMECMCDLVPLVSNFSFENIHSITLTIIFHLITVLNCMRNHKRHVYSNQIKSKIREIFSDFQVRICPKWIHIFEI